MLHLKEFRIKKNLTLTQLSKLTGLSVGYLCHLENGSRTNPSYKSLSLIANALNIDISLLID